MYKKFFVLFITCLMLWACNTSPKEQQPLNEEEFIQLLVDVHMADAAMSTKNIYTRRDDYQPSYYYNSIYKKHGINQAQFDSMIVFYTQRNAKFDRIYERVIDSLNRLETKLKIESKNAPQKRDTINLWVRKKSWKFNKEDAQSLKFNIPVKERGFYTIRADVKIDKLDQSMEPQIQAYFWKMDGTKEGERLEFDPIQIVKDGKFHPYETKLELADSTFTQLRGDFLYRENPDNEFKQNIEIRNILIFNPKIKKPRHRRIPRELMD